MTDMTAYLVWDLVRGKSVPPHHAEHACEVLNRDHPEAKNGFVFVPVVHYTHSQAIRPMAKVLLMKREDVSEMQRKRAVRGV